MRKTLNISPSLSEFLKRSETKPALEYINGTIIQKPMPDGEHSLIQGALCEKINTVTEAAKTAVAFPELRCTFAGRSLVPDIAVFRWQRIPKNDGGRIISENQRLDVFSQDAQLSVLEGIDLSLTVADILGWLTF